jgi:hypothetical protein
MLFKKVSIGLASFALLLLISQIAAADAIVNFSDTVTYWPGYSNGTGDDSWESIGEPNITGGAATFDDSGKLLKVEFNFTVPSPGWQFEKMKPGDLFLDTDANGSWDYVVSSYNGRSNADEVNKYIPTGTVALFGISKTSSLLETGHNDNPSGAYWSGYGFRNDHPFAYTGLTDNLGTGSIAGGYYNASPLVFNLPLVQLPFGTQLTIGFAENCANDVVLATIDVPPDPGPPAVPEPSTLILLGLGLTGIGAYRKIRS